MSCGGVTKPRSLPIAGFYSNKNLIVSLCTALEHYMNYQNSPLCPDFLMNE
jgi:hypothetical protein